MKEWDLNIRIVDIILQITMLINIIIKYFRIMLTIELEWKNRTMNLESTILWLVKYKAIWKGNNAKLAIK